MKIFVKIISIFVMLATVAWFFHNPIGWVPQWEPIVTFLSFLAAFFATIPEEKKPETLIENAHPNDITLFQEFLNVTPNGNFIEFLKNHDFLLDFKLDNISPLRTFIYEWDNAQHEFQNPNLEQLRQELLASAKDFDNKICLYTSPNNAGFQAVRVDHLKHKDEHEDRFRNEAKIINAACQKFFNLHQELVRKGRNICNLSA